jgi:RHS repeat-associated protein
VLELKTNTRTDSTPSGSTSRTSAYAYDDEIRLTDVSTDVGGLFGTDTEVFTLDAVGNRTAHSKVTGSWTYDANNRLKLRGTGAGSTSYDYDEAGSLVKKTEGGVVTTYDYDTQARLTEVKRAGQLLARYGYDPMHRRIWREQYRDRQGNALAQAQRTLYLYADEGLIAQATQNITLNADQSVTASAAPEIAAQYGPRPNSTFTTGVLFVKATGGGSEPQFAYYHHDHLQTPLQATDKQGRIVWSATYNAFGQASTTTPAASAGQRVVESLLRFPGQLEDAETGLHYNFHRYYDPQTGRYVQSDPIGLDGGVNIYAYVGGNPVSYLDPKGLVKWSGTYHARALIEATGAGWVDLALTSDCVNGKRFNAQVKGVGPGFGVGVPKLPPFGSETYGRVDLKDPYDDINPNHLSGRFFWGSVGFSVGTFDQSVGWVVVGSARGPNPQHASGLDIGASMILGSATVMGGTGRSASVKPSEKNLLRANSILASVLLALVPPALYFFGTEQPTRVGLLYYQAAFYLVVSMLFFLTNRYSKSIALFALLRWACESCATFGRAYRTRFFGALALCAFGSVLFELIVGQRVTSYFGSS